MSNPGGPYWQEPQPQYQVDPITGRPTTFQPQGHPQPSGYQGLGMYPQPGKPNRTPVIVALVAAMVVVIGVAVTVFVASGGSDPEPVAAPQSTESAPTSSTSRRRASTSPPPASKTPTEVSDITVDPVIAGWQGVLSFKEKVAYDVPPGWKPEKPGVLVGFEDNEGKPTATMHGVSTYKPDACTGVRGSYRGRVGLVTAGKVETTLAAKNGVKLFAEAAALNTDGSKSPVTATEPVSTKVAQGKIDAVLATATLTVDQPGDCPSPTVLFTAVAFKNGADTALFMMYADQGVPDALAPDVAQQVIASLRPYQE
ncbi:hypothetical protein [Actinokineospora sp.]|uniref:hypothetical protein n=1 Tax=Actinokineospora sp. TaxID=1872133 RepID=UPI0040381BF2